MSYGSDMTWVQWAQLLESTHGVLDNALNQALLVSQKWAKYSYGKTDAELSGSLGKSETDIANMRIGYGNLKTLYDLAHGSVAQTPAYNFLDGLALF